MKLANLGGICLNRNELAEARQCFDEARQIAARRRDRFLAANITFDLTYLELREGNGVAALANAREALPVISASQDPHQTWMALELTGATLVAVERHVEGVKLLGAAEARRLSAGDEPNPDGADVRSSALARAESAIGRKVLADALEAGRALSGEQVAALVLSS